MTKLFNFDKKLKQQGYLIGTDEAGRGPLAGPVVAAAVCYPEITKELQKKLELVNDSKKLTSKQREYLFELIKDNSVYSITVIDVKEIEKINILKSALKAMKISCENVQQQLNEEVEVVIDGNKLIPDLKFKQSYIIKGDGKSASIASASILAKVYRDNLMNEYAKQFPQYDWGNNKGYGTKKHIEAILKYGETPLHRQSFLKKIYERENTKQLVLDL
ncbi:MAG: ribonuclease HII [Candidatus Gastranaerophilales bacterium]|nr:ribonuclease HII [Candidatus Gastranaerophilales bacterium]